MRKLLGALVLLLFPALLRAQCTGSSPTWTSTPDESSVSTCVSKASAGDTINVTGSGSVTWTSQLAVAKPLSIIGPGSANLTVLDNAGSSRLIQWTGTYGTAGCASTSVVCFRFSGFTISPFTSTTAVVGPLSVSGTCTSTSCPNVRIDHNSFTGWSESGNGLYASWLILTDNVFGVVDHNFVSNDHGFLANVNHSAYLGVGTYGDNSWAAPDSFGTANALYFENNTYDSNNTSNNDCDASPNVVGGCRLVVRFNTFNNPYSTAVTNHGTESAGRNRGGRQIEVYANTINCSHSSGDCATAGTGIRSGTLMSWGNGFTASNGGWFNSAVSLADYRTYVNFSPWSVADGTSPYDSNDGTVYATGTYTGTTGSQNFVDSSKSWTTNQWAGYSIHNVTQNFGEQITSNTSNTITPQNQAICNWGRSVPCTWTNGDSYQILRVTVSIDQPGRGSGTLYSGSSTSCAGYSNAASPCSPANENLDPIYEWADVLTGSGFNFGPISAIGIQTIANRDYYSETQNQTAQTSPTSPFNGTSGMGHGTLANLPTTCTAGVGYFATDQGRWNTTNTSIPWQSFTQGELFVCRAANIWTLYYTPYTYPHPLVSGSTGTAGNPPNRPTGLMATVQ